MNTISRVLRYKDGHRLFPRVCKGCGGQEYVLKPSVNSLCRGCYTAQRKRASDARQANRVRYARACPDCGVVSLVVQKRSVGSRCIACSKKKHGLSRTRLYKIWIGMVARTTNPRAGFYVRYGGRGIKVCEEWGDVHAFIQWAKGHGYTSELQIDRINNDGDYSPENCRWTTAATNCRNRSTSLLSAGQVAAIREHLSNGNATQLQLARLFGVSRSTVNMIKSGANWTAA